MKRLTTFIGLGILALNIFSTASAQTDCYTPPSGIVGWWPGEGNGNDIVGANNASVPDGVTYAPAEVGLGFNLNGNTNRILVPDAPQLNFGSNQDFTIETWIQPLADPGNYQDVMTVVSKRFTPDIFTAVGYEMFLVSGELSFQIDDTSNNGQTFYSAGPDLRQDGKFHHVAVTVQRNSTTGLRFYVDGQLISTFDPTSVPGDLSNTWPLRIGNHPTTNLLCFYNGIIDEVSLYNRSLSSNEIASIYNAGSAGKCDGPFPPGISVQPVGQTILEGSNVVLSVASSGTGPFNYQWTFNGKNITGATNATLNLGDLHPYQSGNYSVTVSTTFGSITSSVAAVTVIAQNILVYKYSATEKITTLGQESLFAYSGQMFFIPASTNGTFVGWATINGKKQYWVNPFSDYLLIPIPGSAKRTYTILGKAGEEIDADGYPHIWSYLHQGLNASLTIANKRQFSFPDTFACNETHVYPDPQTSNMVLSESVSTYTFSVFKHADRQQQY